MIKRLLKRTLDNTLDSFYFLLRDCPVPLDLTTPLQITNTTPKFYAKYLEELMDWIIARWKIERNIDVNFYVYFKCQPTLGTFAGYSRTYNTSTKEFNECDDLTDCNRVVYKLPYSKDAPPYDENTSTTARIKDSTIDFWPAYYNDIAVQLSLLEFMKPTLIQGMLSPIFSEFIPDNQLLNVANRTTPSFSTTESLSTLHTGAPGIKNVDSSTINTGDLLSIVGFEGSRYKVKLADARVQKADFIYNGATAIAPNAVGSDVRSSISNFINTKNYPAYNPLVYNPYIYVSLRLGDSVRTMLENAPPKTLFYLSTTPGKMTTVPDQNHIVQPVFFKQHDDVDLRYSKIDGPTPFPFSAPYFTGTLCISPEARFVYQALQLLDAKQGVPWRALDTLRPKAPVVTINKTGEMLCVDLLKAKAQKEVNKSTFISKYSILLPDGTKFVPTKCVYTGNGYIFWNSSKLLTTDKYLNPVSSLDPSSVESGYQVTTHRGLNDIPSGVLEIASGSGFTGQDAYFLYRSTNYSVLLPTYNTYTTYEYNETPYSILRQKVLRPLFPYYYVPFLVNDPPDDEGTTTVLTNTVEDIASPGDPLFDGGSDCCSAHPWTSGCAQIVGWFGSGVPEQMIRAMDDVCFNYCDQSDPSNCGKLPVTIFYWNTTTTDTIRTPWDIIKLPSNVKHYFGVVEEPNIVLVNNVWFTDYNVFIIPMVLDNNNILYSCTTHAGSESIQVEDRFTTFDHPTNPSTSELHVYDDRIVTTITRKGKIVDFNSGDFLEECNSDFSLAFSPNPDISMINYQYDKVGGAFMVHWNDCPQRTKEQWDYIDSIFYKENNNFGELCLFIVGDPYTTQAQYLARSTNVAYTIELISHGVGEVTWVLEGNVNNTIGESGNKVNLRVVNDHKPFLIECTDEFMVINDPKCNEEEARMCTLKVKVWPRTLPKTGRPKNTPESLADAISTSTYQKEGLNIVSAYGYSMTDPQEDIADHYILSTNTGVTVYGARVGECTARLKRGNVYLPTTVYPDEASADFFKHEDITVFIWEPRQVSGAEIPSTLAVGSTLNLSITGTSSYPHKWLSTDTNVASIAVNKDDTSKAVITPHKAGTFMLIVMDSARIPWRKQITVS